MELKIVYIQVFRWDSFQEGIEISIILKERKINDYFFYECLIIVLIFFNIKFSKKNIKKHK